MKTFLHVFTLLALVAVLALGTMGQAWSASNIIYVKASASGTNNGSSWTNAYKSLRSALSAAISGDQIWVAAGTYKPDTGTNRSSTFALKNGVAVYGGFAGTENSLSQRNYTLHVTILSGDIGIVGDTSDNSYEVVSTSSTNSTAILDGFKIMDGNANCGCFPGDAGGGVFNWGSSPTLRNLTISNNATAGYGGGMYNNGSNPTVTNVTISDNTTESYGGGMYNGYGSIPTLTNVTFSGNMAISFGYGGGMYNDGSSPHLTNVTFSNNTTVNNGGGMFNTNGSNPTLTDVTFQGNSASGHGGGIYNYNSSPTLTNITFSTNSASGNGGGIYDTGTTGSDPTLTDVTFSSNSAINGGGVYNNSSSPAFTNVTFSDNSASGSGGGIYNYYTGSNLTLTDVTFSGNTSNSNGGGIYDTGSSPVLKNVTLNGNLSVNGGGIYNDVSCPTLTNATFSGNTASANGSAIGNDDNSYLNIYDSIFWNDGTSGEIWNGSFAGTTIDDSLVEGGCPWAGTCTNILNANPLLGPLKNNSGYTETMALGAKSPAIDAGNNATCTSKDQRGVPRPQDGNGDGVAVCDMGAYEYILLKLYLPLVLH